MRSRPESSLVPIGRDNVFSCIPACDSIYSQRRRISQICRENTMASIRTVTPESSIHAEEPRSNVQRSLLWVSLLVTLAFMFGCGYHHKGPPWLQKIDGRASVFRLGVIEPFGLYKEYVNDVQVLECVKGPYYDTPGQLLWEVIAASQVRANGFEVVAGQVPEGFRQAFPPPSETFKPVPGRWYVIAVSSTYPKVGIPSITRTSWLAD